jgi:uncharacterized LabA/DUF88 family protein
MSWLSNDPIESVSVPTVGAGAPDINGDVVVLVDVDSIPMGEIPSDPRNLALLVIDTLSCQSLTQLIFVSSSRNPTLPQWPAASAEMSWISPQQLPLLSISNEKGRCALLVEAASSLVALGASTVHLVLVVGDSGLLPLAEWANELVSEGRLGSLSCCGLDPAESWWEMNKVRTVVPLHSHVTERSPQASRRNIMTGEPLALSALFPLIHAARGVKPRIHRTSTFGQRVLFIDMAYISNIVRRAEGGGENIALALPTASGEGTLSIVHSLIGAEESVRYDCIRVFDATRDAKHSNFHLQLKRILERRSDAVVFHVGLLRPRRDRSGILRGGPVREQSDVDVALLVELAKLSPRLLPSQQREGSSQEGSLLVELVAGDGDFAPLCASLRRGGRLAVRVYAQRGSLSSALERAVDEVRPLVPR